MKKGGTLILIAIVGGIIAMGIAQGINRSEKAECETWGRQATEYKGFYLAKWQKDQCDAHGIHIEAPVR